MRRSAAFALALLLVCSCAPLDRRPLLSSASYVAAVDAIDRAAPRALRGRGAYRAGWARVPIDLPSGVPLAGYGERDRARSLAVKDPVAVRAFAISAGEPSRPIVVFTADLLLVPPEVAEAVRLALRDVLPRARLVFTASHTHSGPGGFASGLLWELVFGPPDPRVLDAVVRAHADAARRALADLGPAAIGSAEVEVEGLVKNRVERGGPTDDHLFVLTFERDDGRRAALWSFGCHAVTLPATSLVVSADYPGEVARSIEGQGLEVLGFAAGGVGSSNPRHERRDTSWLVEPLARALRRGVDEARRSATKVGPLAAVSLELPMPSPRYRVTRDVMLLGPLTRAVVETSPATFGAVAIGDTLVASVPGELSGELTAEARASARAAGLRLAILPFDGSYVGYVVSRRAYDLPDERGDELLEYETRTLAFFGPDGGDLVLGLALHLARGVLHTARTSAWPEGR